MFYRRLIGAIALIAVPCVTIVDAQAWDDAKYPNLKGQWVRAEGEVATVGITDHAQHELTDVVFVELPAVGRKVKAGEACAVVESVKTASDIYSPVSGEIIEANHAIVENPALVNADPYGGGTARQSPATATGSCGVISKDRARVGLPLFRVTKIAFGG